MSCWKWINDPDHVQLSDDGKDLEVWMGADYLGSEYLVVPVDLVKKALGLEADSMPLPSPPGE